MTCNAHKKKDCLTADEEYHEESVLFSGIAGIMSRVAFYDGGVNKIMFSCQWGNKNFNMIYYIKLAISCGP